MSIASAFNAARSALTVTGRWAEVTSNNISNADRPEYTRRGLTLDSVGDASGVRVAAVQREMNAALDREYRLETGRVARQDTVAELLDAYTAKLGSPGTEGTVSARMTGLQSSFDLLSANPADPALQRNVLDAADGMTRSLNKASRDLKETTAAVTARIVGEVEVVNGMLGEVGEINRQIAIEEKGSRRMAVLEDQLATRLDGIAQVMDFTLERDAAGRAELRTRSGAELVAGTQVTTISFDAASGALFAGASEITPGETGVRGFGEGRLAGEIELRNAILPQMELQLDEMAGALVAGFEMAEGLAGSPGLFTDAGAAYDPASREGLAGRITVNDAVRPEAGGALWRLRDGVSAATPGYAGDSTQITAYSDLLSGPVAYDPAAGLGTGITMTDYAAGLMAEQHAVRVDAETQAESLALGTETIAHARAGLQGVNIDEELQQLMAVEQSYAANSQVMRTLDDMMETLLAAIR
ncbi:flagellar hook-associated protein FlgK [Profundibacterium mesophilum]|uniref:Flagellar hook-associated protein 1 n=1 Tax=Profundibacterium mesophilum KAUST100406-0324 TaxID=1037889 RepID=A0A921NSL1_9RHOB|nr:flagellar hook-associated protein FlgK [Profundibacterium mesophilum]KAF0674643.1 flagellar hook-associated protein 1 FlgK [Profundibacterium mesophilum KAUST100406-0324]